jgi:hypothetical protein
LIVTDEQAWEAYLNEQKLILGLPGLMAKPSFIAGYRAALASSASDKQEAVATTDEQRDAIKWALNHMRLELRTGKYADILRGILAAPPANPSDKQEAVALWAAFDWQGILLAHSKVRPGLSDVLKWEPLYHAPLTQSAEQDRIDAERIRQAKARQGEQP